MRKTLKIHALWAIAVLAAFAVGWKNGIPSVSGPGDDAAAQRNASGDSRFSGSEAGDPSSRRGKRTAEKSEGSALGRLFGLTDSSDSNLELLLEQALRDPNRITRRLAFAKLLESMTPENAASMREQLVAIGADPDQWRDFHYAWGALDGKTAFDHATNSPERDLAATMTGWAAANPAEALALLNNLPEEIRGQSEELTASVIEGLADNNRALATDYVLQLGREGNGQAASLMEIVTNETLRAEGPEAASRWIGTLPDGPLKSTAMGRVADAYVRKNPVAAASWAREFAGESYASSAIERIGGNWAQTDPVAAVGWLETLPASNGQSAGLRIAFGDWEDRDPAAAGEYLAKMPLSPQRDSSISGFAMGYAWQNPQIAIAWAQEIRDPVLRESSLTRAGHAFYRRDPNGALAWLENSGLSEDARRKVVQPEQRR